MLCYTFWFSSSVCFMHLNLLWAINFQYGVWFTSSLKTISSSILLHCTDTLLNLGSFGCLTRVCCCLMQLGFSFSSNIIDMSFLLTLAGVHDWEIVLSALCGVEVIANVGFELVPFTFEHMSGNEIEVRLFNDAPNFSSNSSYNEFIITKN